MDRAVWKSEIYKWDRVGSLGGVRYGANYNWNIPWKLFTFLRKLYCYKSQITYCSELMRGWCTGDALVMHLWCADDALVICCWSTDDTLVMRGRCTDDALMMHWWCRMMHCWCTFEDMMMMTRCQDHILTENIWFGWSKTSYSEDTWRCHRCGTNKQTREDRALSQWAPGRLSKQN